MFQILQKMPDVLSTEYSTLKISSKEILNGAILVDRRISSIANLKKYSVL